jgi:hypothetical protein
MPPVSYWKDSNQLGLIGDQAIEWDRYKRALVGAGILLAPMEDELRWSGGDGSGFPTGQKSVQSSDREFVGSSQLWLGFKTLEMEIGIETEIVLLAAFKKKKFSLGML